MYKMVNVGQYYEDKIGIIIIEIVFEFGNNLFWLYERDQCFKGILFYNLLLIR